MVCEAALSAAKALIGSTRKAHAPGTMSSLPGPRLSRSGVTVEMTIIPLNDRFPLNGIFLPDGGR